MSDRPSDSDNEASLGEQLKALRGELRAETSRRDSAERVVQHQRTMLEQLQQELSEAQKGASSSTDLQLALAESRELANAYERNLARLRARFEPNSDDTDNPAVAELKAELAEARAMAEASSEALESAFEEVLRLEGEVERLSPSDDATPPATPALPASATARVEDAKLGLVQETLASTTAERDALADQVAQLEAALDAAGPATSDELQRLRAELETNADAQQRLQAELRGLARQYEAEVGGLRSALERTRLAHEQEVEQLRAKLELMRATLGDSDQRVQRDRDARAVQHSAARPVEQPRPADEEPRPALPGKDLTGEVRSIRAAYASQDFEWLASIARHLKVTFKHRGVHGLADIASHMELASWAGDIEAIPQLVQSFETIFYARGSGPKQRR